MDTTSSTIAGETNTPGTTTISGNQRTSIVNTTTLKTALSSNNVIIDANVIVPDIQDTIYGFGVITVADDILAATSGSNSLTLTGAQIIINANITMASNANLILTANKASVWQAPTKVITANTVSGSSVDGFSLGGANLITRPRQRSPMLAARGFWLRITKVLTINAGTINGSKGGVMILDPGL